MVGAPFMCLGGACIGAGPGACLEMQEGSIGGRIGCQVRRGGCTCCRQGKRQQQRECPHGRRLLGEKLAPELL